MSTGSYSRVQRVRRHRGSTDIHTGQKIYTIQQRLDISKVEPKCNVRYVMWYYLKRWRMPEPPYRMAGESKKMAAERLSFEQRVIILKL
jgi:hypothetical protein